MKKRKNRESPPPDFRNHPFKDLKKVAAKLPAARAKAASAVSIPHDHGDERELFERAVAGVKRIGSSGRSGPEEKDHYPKVTTSPSPPAGIIDKKIFLDAMQKLGAVMPVPPDEEGDVQARSQTSRMRQLKRGTIRISEELDLHGCLKDEALRLLAAFITGSSKRGRKAVLVITGKGLNSPDGPVLQGAVDIWLRKTGKELVAEVTQAPRDKGGSGAFVVFLKNNKSLLHETSTAVVWQLRGGRSRSERNKTRSGKCHYNQNIFGRDAVNPHDKHALYKSVGFEG
jgi:DNA-nicking Smr family endonuclease